MRKLKRLLLIGLIVFSMTGAAACGPEVSDKGNQEKAEGVTVSGQLEVSDIPEYSGEPYIEINGNEPDFDQDQITDKSFEEYSQLDSLGRCQEAEASIGEDLMPTEERGSIGQIKPSGWHTVKYDNVDGKYLYNRCHLIGYQLTAENANEENLITGTRYMNVEGMLPFENMVADYIKETGNHVMYEVTPVYDGDDLVASGVHMEGYSVEDEGEGISFNIYAYNVQPGIEIDYATGESREAEDSAGDSSNETQGGEYVINTNTGKFHRPDCSSVEDIKPENKKEYTGSREELTKQGYEPCGRCRP
ncbi:MAG TPA: DNA/RNA non-specific endonuclease [Candidatus Eubacterium avistercoris]|uniref:DNA/RNA non-specific endonuclease n=1 Tax=Candidatus Eubacterium avistercoris TaxID=2838567 RepID=A0A9D2D1S8_9FIRM|nr:DNA/RNA non-specific endonuclease [Candidatus Eubacterium avistercoris]